MLLTQKIRIYPSGDQEEILWELSEINRRLYNYALSERKYAFEDGIQGINYIKQQNNLPMLKEEYTDLKKVNARVLQQTLRVLDANYSSFFKLIKKDSSARPPGYKGHEYFTTMKYNQAGYKFSNGCISLSHNIKDGAKLLFEIQHVDIQKIKQVEIYKVHNKSEWYLSIVGEISTKPFVDNGLYQAWDLGITKQTGVNIRGKFTEIFNIRPDKYWNPKIDNIQSRRDHCRKHGEKNKPSRKWKHFKSLQDRMTKKRGNQMKDFQHKVSLMIIENTKSNTIIIGDLDVKRMPKAKNATRGMNRSTQGTGYLGRFAEFLTYKGSLVGKKVTEISERNTTKSCCCCGKLHDMPTSKRVMKCDCGNELDRDKNSAINIMIRYLSYNALWTSYWQFVNNLRKTGVEILQHPQEASRASSPSIRQIVKAL